ncbi:heterokaryon incompatibility protein-domain-containing protein [Cladorrhinum samala]|uniref:Heterokaryon incompatibility protein-domain-containing protein n=1 Tax=Cladorrhinum samala TaxID=585594 RepID=A0AAV9I006_9PEZI|nr:heterokaryon incompatibility protein-domain-containing protein [Cladorrhinum samala]
MASKLCAACTASLGAPHDELGHHQSTEDVLKAAGNGCYICGVIIKSGGWRAMLETGKSFCGTSSLKQAVNVPPGWMKLTIDSFLDDADEQSEDDFEDQSQDTGEIVGGPGFVLPEPPLWGFILQPLEDVQHNVGNYRPVRGDLESPDFLELPLRWFRDCVKNHASCSEKLPGYFPTRVLEIVSKDFARVVDTRCGKPEGRYASLSHCWGKAKTLKLLSSNIEQLCTTGLPVSTLPQSYREAVTVCLGFGIRYIWIDSLCIIQDSPEDWSREAITMKDVYENTVLNIAAAAAAESSDASFSCRNVDFIRPIQVQSRCDSNGPTKPYYVIDESIYKSTIRESPLHQRAWVMQEIMLTSRNLSLTSTQLWWECLEFDACETYPNGLPRGWLSPEHYAVREIEADPQMNPQDVRRKIYVNWTGVAEKYSSCFLSFPSDKMIAFAGIARQYLSRLEAVGGDEYLAGLWKSQLPRALLWCTHRIRPCYRPPGAYRAPSWSWMSVEGPIWLDHAPPLGHRSAEVDVLTEVVGVGVHLVDENHRTGFVKGGYIRLKAMITEFSAVGNTTYLGAQRCGNPDETTVPDSETESLLHMAFDETNSNGLVGMSYSSSVMMTDQQWMQGELGETTRTTIWLNGSGKDDDTRQFGRLFALPIIQWVHEGKRYREGITLVRQDEWPANIFQRVGDFSAEDTAIDAIDERAQKDVVVTIV